MPDKPYGMICPITKACELLEPRWTIPILSEMWGGSTRFNDIRRGVGSISPALLSKRLREMESKGLIERIEDPATGAVDYIRTTKAVELEPTLNAMAEWAQRHIEAETALCDINLSTLMWKMRKYVYPDQLPSRRVVMQFRFGDPGLDYDTYWVVVVPQCPVEVCTAIPGFDVDLFVETTIMSLTSIITARSTIAREIEAERTYLSGDALLMRTMDRWMCTGSYRVEGRQLLCP
jgi:DNA-binding HxlR family transcriptional regulator